MARKSDIVEGLTSQVEGLSKRQAGEVFDIIFDKVTDLLADGDRVQIANFGTFSVSARPARQGRNPQTGEAITIAASNVVRFKAGKALKDAVNA
jgi:DNA-binding protein HU-beta